MSFLSNATEIVQFVITITAALTTIGTAIFAAYSRIKAKIADKENSVKDIATAAIIEFEQLLDTSKEALKEAGLDTGTYKYEGVVAKIQTACSDLKLSFDSGYWDTFIESQVAVLNATKITEEVLK